MDGTLRSPRLPAVVVLILFVLPASVAAQHFVCRPIAPGDTAADLARRLTGHAEAAYGLAFQIRDPARRMFVPKSHYPRLQADWQACVAPDPVRNAPAAYAPLVQLAAWTMVPGKPVATAPPVVVSPSSTQARADRTLTSVLLAVTIGAAALLTLMLSPLAGSLPPRAIPQPVRRAGENFVTVFARPLIDPSSAVPPIQMRLRFVRRTQHLEILMAPGPGHRYPNLADHKSNVEYDVDRVMRVLGDFRLARPPRPAGKWVVITLTPAEGSWDEYVRRNAPSARHARSVPNEAALGSVLFREAESRK